MPALAARGQPVERPPGGRLPVERLAPDDRTGFGRRDLGACEAEVEGTPAGRVSRFTVTADGTADVVSQHGNIDDHPLGMTVGGVYEIVLFHAERNECGSNFKVTLKDGVAEVLAMETMSAIPIEDKVATIS